MPAISMFTPRALTTDSDDISGTKSVSKVLHRYMLQNFKHTLRNASLKYANDANSDLNETNHNERDVYTSNMSSNLTNEMKSVDKLKPYTWKYKRIKRAQQITRLNMGDHRRMKCAVSENKTDSWRKALLNKLRDQHKDRFHLWKTRENASTENKQELSNNDIREDYKARYRKIYLLANAQSSNDNAESYKPMWKGKFKLSDKHKQTCNFCKIKENLSCEKFKPVKENHNLSLKDKFEPRTEGRKKYYPSDDKDKFDHRTEGRKKYYLSDDKDSMKEENEQSTAKTKHSYERQNGLNNEYNAFPFHEKTINNERKYNMVKNEKSGDNVRRVINKRSEEKLTPIHDLDLDVSEAKETNESNYHDLVVSKANETNERNYHNLDVSKAKETNERNYHDLDVSKVKESNERNYKVKEKSTDDWKTHDNELSENKTDESKNEYELPNNKVDEHAKREFVLSWKGKYHSGNEQKEEKFNKDKGTTQPGFKDQQNKICKTHPRCKADGPELRCKADGPELRCEVDGPELRCKGDGPDLSQTQTSDTEFDDNEELYSQMNNTDKTGDQDDDIDSNNRAPLQLQLSSETGRKICYRISPVNTSKNSNMPSQYRILFRSRSPTNSSMYHSSENSRPIKSILRGASSNLSVRTYRTWFDSIGTDDTRSRRSSWRSQIKNWAKYRLGFKTTISSHYESDVTDDVQSMQTAVVRCGKGDVSHTTVRGKVLKKPRNVVAPFKQQNSCPDVRLQRPHTIISDTKDQRHKETSHQDLLTQFLTSYPAENFNKQGEKSCKKKFKITIKKKPKFTDRRACHCEVQNRRRVQFPRSVSIGSHRQGHKTSRQGLLKRGQYTLPTQSRQSSKESHPKVTVHMKQHEMSGQSNRHIKPPHLNQNHTYTQPKSPVNKNGVLSMSPLSIQKQPAIIASHCILQDNNFIHRPKCVPNQKASPHCSANSVKVDSTPRTQHSHNENFKNKEDMVYQQTHAEGEHGLHPRTVQTSQNHAEGENGLQPRTLQKFPSYHQDGVIPLNSSTQPQNYAPRSAENEQQIQSCPQGAQHSQVKVSSAVSVKRVRFEDSLNTCFYYNVLSENSSDTASYEYETFLNSMSLSSPNPVEAVQSSQESQDEECSKQNPKNVFKPAENILFNPTADENTNLSHLNLTGNNGNKSSQPPTSRDSFTEHRINLLPPEVSGDNHFSNIKLEEMVTPSFGYPPRYNGVNEEDRIAYEEPVKDCADQLQTETENKLSRPFQAESANKTQSDAKCTGEKVRSPLPAGTAFYYSTKRPSCAELSDTDQCRKATLPSRGQSILRKSIVSGNIKNSTSHISNSSRTNGGNLRMDTLTPFIFDPLNNSRASFLVNLENSTNTCGDNSTSRADTRNRMMPDQSFNSGETRNMYVNSEKHKTGRDMRKVYTSREKLTPRELNNSPRGGISKPRMEPKYRTVNDKTKRKFVTKHSSIGGDAIEFVKINGNYTGRDEIKKLTVHSAYHEMYPPQHDMHSQHHEMYSPYHEMYSPHQEMYPPHHEMYPPHHESQLRRRHAVAIPFDHARESRPMPPGVLHPLYLPSVPTPTYEYCPRCPKPIFNPDNNHVIEINLAPLHSVLDKVKYGLSYFGYLGCKTVLQMTGHGHIGTEDASKMKEDVPSCDDDKKTK